MLERHRPPAGSRNAGWWRRAFERRNDDRQAASATCGFRRVGELSLPAIFYECHRSPPACTRMLDRSRSPPKVAPRIIDLLESCEYGFDRVTVEVKYGHSHHSEGYRPIVSLSPSLNLPIETVSPVPKYEVKPLIEENCCAVFYGASSTGCT
jgi:hypothetical protein